MLVRLTLRDYSSACNCSCVGSDRTRGAQGAWGSTFGSIIVIIRRGGCQGSIWYLGPLAYVATYVSSNILAKWFITIFNLWFSADKLRNLSRAAEN